MSKTIIIKSVSTEDVKIAQKALETIGFKTIKEEDNYEAYWIKLEVPEQYSHIDVVVEEIHRNRRIIT